VADPELLKKVNLWFTLSIVSIFCGCGLLGIIPIIIANNAKKALAAGDSAKAQKDIGTAKLLCILGYVFVGLYVVSAIIMGAMGAFAHMF
jgi:hypothetical protein